MPPSTPAAASSSIGKEHGEEAVEDNSHNNMNNNTTSSSNDSSGASGEGDSSDGGSSKEGEEGGNGDDENGHDSEDSIQGKKPSISRICAEEEKHLSAIEGRLLRSRKTQNLPSSSVSCSMNANGPTNNVSSIPKQTSKKRPVSLAMVGNVYVSIDLAWEIEKVIDKRLNQQTDKYEYLVRHKNWSNRLDRWVSGAEVSADLVHEYNQQYHKLVKEKRHIEAFYGLEEDFVVQWNDEPYFIVTYGQNEHNKFCIVGLNKAGNSLICKKAHNPGHSHHQVHIQLVQHKLEELSLRIWPTRKYIGPILDVQLSMIPATPNEDFKKPLSCTPIQILSGKEEGIRRLQHHFDSPYLPVEYRPKQPPLHCTCSDKTDAGGQPIYDVCYKAGPDRCSKPTTLWLAHGPPISDRYAYVWNCKNNNPGCARYYDGHEDGIFNYSNATMVSHVIPYEFLYGLISGYEFLKNAA